MNLVASIQSCERTIILEVFCKWVLVDFKDSSDLLPALEVDPQDRIW